MLCTEQIVKELAIRLNIANLCFTGDNFKNA